MQRRCLTVAGFARYLTAMMTGLHTIWRGVKWGFGGLVLAGVGFTGSAYVSALFPTDGRPQSPASGPPIHVCSGTTHSDFAIPLALARSDVFGPMSDHIPANLPAETYVMMGWGDYRFFTEVPTLSHLRPGIAFGALIGRHETALRLQLISEASLQAYCRALPLDEQGQAAIARHILDTVAEPQTALPQSRFGLTYLKAYKRYGVFHTCNDWTARGLRQAGLPTARWHAPFAFSVTWPLRSLPEEWDES